MLRSHFYSSSLFSHLIHRKFSSFYQQGLRSYFLHDFPFIASYHHASPISPDKTLKARRNTLTFTSRTHFGKHEILASHIVNRRRTITIYNCKNSRKNNNNNNCVTAARAPAASHEKSRTHRSLEPGDRGVPMRLRVALILAVSRRH